YDYLVNLLQIFVEGLLFHHPAVWWISGVIRAERENCCDDLVVAVKGGAYEYAAALAALEQHREAVRETALAATGGSLMKRIRRLLPQPLDQPEAPRAALAPVFSAAILTITVAAAMTAWPSKPAERGPAPLHVGAASANPVTPAAQLPARLPASTQLAQAAVPQPRLAQVQPAPVADPPDSPYDKWLKQDVAYIVTDEERSAFKRLQTDEEREKFIEQFWLRRDPTPGTVENEFKEEYYRRIGYANEHFSASVAGWKTDRGRIYLTYGPPDEKEIHPAGSGGAAPAFPSEQWLYHYLEGIGNNIIIEFVDPAMSGDFRMTSDPSGAATLFYVPGAAGYQARIADLSRERANLLKSLTPEHP